MLGHLISGIDDRITDTFDWENNLTSRFFNRVYLKFDCVRMTIDYEVWDTLVDTLTDYFYEEEFEDAW